MNVTERFSDRVENYLKYRPRYPNEIIPFLEKEIALTETSIIADIGSGTGFSSEMFLKNGNTVYGVEPNNEMREAGEKLLAAYPNFHSINATAEDTSLADQSIDIVIAGQAFHWFDVERSKKEFNRILKTGGWVVLIWNNRSLDATPFLITLENFLLEFGTDYPVVKDSEIHYNIKILFRDKGYQLEKFSNVQSLDYDGLQGRILSDSYIPTDEDPNYLPMLKELREIFDKHEVGGKIEILYTTEVYYGQLT